MKNKHLLFLRKILIATILILLSTKSSNSYADINYFYSGSGHDVLIRGNVRAIMPPALAFGVSSENYGSYVGSNQPVSGSFNLQGIPSGSTIVYARFFLGKTSLPLAIGSLIFKGSVVNSSNKFGHGNYDNYEYDVASLVNGSGEHSFSYSGLGVISASMIVVYRNKLLPYSRIRVMGISLPMGEFGFEQEFKEDVGRILMVVSNDIPLQVNYDNSGSNEKILLNGLEIGGPVDCNIGLGASQFEFSVPWLKKSNSFVVTSPDDDNFSTPFVAFEGLNINDEYVNIHVDSNNNGKIDSYRDSAEMEDGQFLDGDEGLSEDSPYRVGALIANTSDSDVNQDDIPDNLNFNNSFVDYHLERLVWYCEADGDVYIDIVEGKNNVKLWKDPYKKQQITIFPCKINYQGSIYVEGVNDGAAKIQIYKEERKEEIHDEVRLFVGRQDVIWPDTISVDEKPIYVLYSLPINTQVKVKIYKNGSLFQSFTKQADNQNSVGFEVDTSSSHQTPGDIYLVKATADKDNLRFDSGPCEVLAGEPDSITYTLSKPSLISDGLDKLNVYLTVKDKFGNFVADGTNVSLDAIKRFNADDNGLIADDSDEGESVIPQNTSSTDVVTKDGKASFEITTSILDDVELLAESGTVEKELTISTVDVTATLTSGTEQLQIDQGQETTVNLQTNATEGAEVFWTVSNTKDAQKAFFQTTVTGGASSIQVSSENGYIGDCWVTATVGEKLALKKLRFSDSSPVRVSLDQRVLIGDITENTVVEQSYATPGSMATVQIPLYAVSNATVNAKPNTQYQIELIDVPNGGLVSFIGATADGKFDTDEHGVAHFSLKSRGVMDPCLPTTESLRFRVGEVDTTSPSINNVAWSRTNNKKSRRLPNSGTQTKFSGARFQNIMDVGPADPQRWSSPQGITVVNRKTGESTWFATWDAVKGFFGADTETLAGAAGNITGGFFVVGDIGAIVKNIYRMGPWSKVKPNYLELSLTMAGLGADAAYVAAAAGVPLNAVINTSRLLVVRFAHLDPHFSVALVTLLYDVIKSISKYRLAKQIYFWKSFGKALIQVIRDPGLRKVCFSSLGNVKSVHNFMRMHRLFGDDWLSYVSALGKSASFNRKNFLLFLKTLSRLDKASLDFIKASPRISITIQRLYQITSQLGYSPILIKIIRDRDRFLPYSYPINVLFRDIARASKYAPREDVNKLLIQICKQLPNVQGGVKGYLYELRVASFFSSIANNYMKLGKKYRQTATHQEGDFDLVTGFVYYTVKSSKSAQKGGFDLEDFWRAAVEDATARGGVVERIVVVVPPGLVIRATRIKVEALREKGVIVDIVDKIRL